MSISRPDILGGASGLTRQVLHLSSNDREALAGLSGAGRLDGGIEGEQVGLAGNRGDGIDDLRDLGRGLLEAPHPLIDAGEGFTDAAWSRAARCARPRGRRMLR